MNIIININQLISTLLKIKAPMLDMKIPKNKWVEKSGGWPPTKGNGATLGV